MNIDWTARFIFSVTGEINNEEQAREVLAALPVLRADAAAAQQRITDALAGMDMLQATAESWLNKERQ